MSSTWFTLDNTIKLGDVLTSVTVAVSIASLILSQAKDRKTKVAEGAKQARLAAAQVITKLDRCARLHLSLFVNLQPDFIDLSRGLEKKFDVLGARDSLWQRVHLASNAVTQHLMDEEIATAYVDLLAFLPDIRALYVDAYAAMEHEAGVATDAFLTVTQMRIQDLQGQREHYTPALLGNQLRDVAWTETDKLGNRLELIVAPVREFVFFFILQADEEIARVRKSPRPLAPAPALAPNGRPDTN